MLIYAGSEFMTSDAIADAVLRYSAALAEGRGAATIDVPIVGRDGTASSAAFLLGPASQIVSRDFETDITEPDDPELVLSGASLIGVAFDPHGGLAIATTDAVYRLNVGLRGILPLSPQ